MDPKKQLKFKPLLEELANELRTALQNQDSGAAPVSVDSSIGRLSRIDAIQSQQMALEMKRRQQNHLSRVERALSAIRQGTYGQCVKCGGEIAEARLKAQPDAFLCLNCAAATSKR